MRVTRQRPNSQHGAPSSIQSTVPQGRKVFNCIVDDTALVAGVKRSTRNGIRQWVKNGQIRLFVPLHALEHMSRQKSTNNRYGEDVRETLQWLDDATSRFPNSVTLQGADEIYEKWIEVERFAVPRTLFSESDHVHDLELEQVPSNSPEQTMSKLTLDNLGRKTPVSSAGSDVSGPRSPSSLRSQRSSLSAVSPPTSPIKAASSPIKSAQVQSQQATSSSASVPLRLQPLFNYILWRIHQEMDPVAALESFIFLCNDQSKVDFAKGFDIKTKRLEQLRDAIGREDRDFRNRQMVVNRENHDDTGMPATYTPQRFDHEMAHSPKATPKAPAAMLSQRSQIPAQPNVIDPDAFERDPAIAPPAEPMQSPRPQFAVPQVSRGGAIDSYGTRGGHLRGNFRGVTHPRGRGNFAPRGRGGFSSYNRMDGMLPAGQIDPNSFTRPRGNENNSRGARKLWVPT